MTVQEERPDLVTLQALAELLGRLLLREVEARDLERLRAPELAAALADLGVELPDPDAERAWIEERGADYHELFLSPEAGPLVQSLWTQGRYEGDATARVRQLAELAAVEFQRDVARGAPVDHLGSLLLLWSASAERAPAIAEELCRQHLAWSRPALARLRAQGGFYGAVASAAAELVELLVAEGA